MMNLTQWRDQLTAQGYAARTVEAKAGAVRSAAEHAGVEPHQLTRDDVLAWLGAPGRAAWTRIKYAGHMRAWCAAAGLPDLTAGIRSPRQPVGVPRPVSEGDLARMLHAAEPGRERAWVVLGAFAGLRSHESAKVARGDLIRPAGAPLLHVLGKGGQTALVPASPVVVDVLEAAAQLVEPGARLWPSASSGAVQASIRRVAARAGVECSSHQLRHRYGTAIYAGGRDLLLTQRLMRHASPSTTAGYARVADDVAAAAVAGLPGAQLLQESEPGAEQRRHGLRVVR